MERDLRELTPEAELVVRGPPRCATCWGAARSGRRATRLLDALAEVLAACAARGVQVVPLRGPPSALHPPSRSRSASSCARRFLHPAGHVVTMQWEVESADLVHGPPLHEVWQRAAPATVAGQPCVSLAHTDLFLLLCVRGNRAAVAASSLDPRTRQAHGRDGSL